MAVKEETDVSDIHIGVLIARFQVPELSNGHMELVDYIMSRHKKIIIFLGVSTIQNTRRNPLDYANRQAMCQEKYPNAVILPLVDQDSNEMWSQVLDSSIPIPFGDKAAVLYGSRDSFIPYYSGKYKTIELAASLTDNGTEKRDMVSREIINSPDFRSGIIHEIYAKDPNVYPVVNICTYNSAGEILLVKKPHEKQWGLPSGNIVTTDENYEQGAKRVFSEKVGINCEINSCMYLFSQRLNEPRYAKETDVLLSSVYLAEMAFGRADAGDGISEVGWFPVNMFSNLDGVNKNIMPQYRDMMNTLISKIYSSNIDNKIPGIIDSVK